MRSHNFDGILRSSQTLVAGCGSFWAVDNGKFEATATIAAYLHVMPQVNNQSFLLGATAACIINPKQWLQVR